MFLCGNVMGSYLGIHEVIKGRCDSDAGEEMAMFMVLAMGLPRAVPLIHI